jgi:preprotein translocase subunit SecE
VSMNRQTKRLMQKQGSDKPGQAQQRRPQPAPVQRDKVGPREYFSEVKGELRKVAWPTRKEVINSTIIVLIAVVVMTALIFGFDYVSSKFVLFLFD